jgi:tetratricopeptide (TPR) repeat protein|tara:strand:+ start:246 stop:1595 length:1350 start_codon:yes stop_codon:yes gene_type:complete
MKINKILVLLLFIILASCQKQKNNRLLAEKHFKEGNYPQALKELNRLIKNEPDSISYYGLRILVYKDLGMFREEIKDLSKVITLNTKSKSIGAHNERAIAYLRLSKNKKALADINYVIENKKDLENIEQIYIQKASILYSLKDLKTAELFYKKAIESINNQDNTIVSQALIGLSNISTNSNEALDFLKQAIEKDPKNGMAFGARATIYLRQENIDSAYKDFQIAKKLDPSNSLIHFNIGQLYANHTKNLDSAIYYFEKTIKLSPQAQNNDMIYTSLGVIKHRAGRFAEAMQDLETAEKLNSENDLLLYNYAMLLSDEGEYSKALVKLNKAIEINSTDPEYYNLKGNILMDKLNFNESERAFKKAIEINPSYGTPYYNLGYLKSKQNNIQEGIKYYDRAIQLDFDLPATLVNRALLKIKLNKTKEACSDLNRALKLGRTDIKPLIEKICR